MKKRRIGRKFSLKADQRKALLKSLASNLILKEKIETTEAKAKELSRFIEKLIAQAVHLQEEGVILKEEGLTKRRLLSKIFPPKVNKKLASEIAVRYKERKGGFTRIIKLGVRKSDGARMAIIELIK